MNFATGWEISESLAHASASQLILKCGLKTAHRQQFRQAAPGGDPSRFVSWSNGKSA